MKVAKRVYLEKFSSQEKSVYLCKVMNNLRYVDGTTLRAESEEEPKSLLMKVKVEREKLA